ncbi:hypothetical protein LTR56_004238 [Elasticomyces elasticus]|nr:hypothetical protein LTR56_004238 [Elasticomyces elasticus]KAK3655127.1 hypothetical protein LTR22_010437 [Elasticomyces elasticus]KAK4907712.1 hypothetical protein LTR49_023308 [Elasticomyces elasticus]KAK5750576.1 hypothetical protein LTS12_019366 [Elasticomyces elasticus]
MLVEGKAYVLSPTDCNNKRQRRRDEYGLIRDHDRTAQEQIENYTATERARAPSPVVHVKDEFVQGMPQRQDRQVATVSHGYAPPLEPPLPVINGGNHVQLPRARNRGNKRCGVILQVASKKIKLPAMHDACSVGFSEFGFQSVQRFGTAAQREWLVKLGSPNDVERVLQAPRVMIADQVGSLRGWKIELQPSRDPASGGCPPPGAAVARHRLPSENRAAENSTGTGQQGIDLSATDETSQGPTQHHSQRPDRRAVESQTQIAQPPADSAQASSVDTPAEFPTSHAAIRNHLPPTRVFINEEPLTVSPADIVFAVSQNSKHAFNLQTTPDRKTVILTFANAQAANRFGAPIRNFTNQQTVFFRPAYNVHCLECARFHPTMPECSGLESVPKPFLVHAPAYLEEVPPMV